MKNLDYICGANALQNLSGGLAGGSSDILKRIYLRKFLTVGNFATFTESVKDEATVDGLCGYVYYDACGRRVSVGP